MTQTTARASAVIVGAGIVGNSLAYHLARLGWRDVVLVDKGPMPNPGGSTGHASNFIFPIEYSKMMFDLTTDSTAQYQQLGVFTQSGGHFPTVGVVDPLRAGTLMREAAQRSGALTVLPGAEVTGIETASAAR